jgi:hypothetical protein
MKLDSVKDFDCLHLIKEMSYDHAELVVLRPRWTKKKRAANQFVYI